MEQLDERLPDSVDMFVREIKDSPIFLRFIRKTTIPNPNFYDVYFGKKKIGYISIPHFSMNWTVVCDTTGNRNHFRTRQEAEDYMVLQVEVILGR